MTQRRKAEAALLSMTLIWGGTFTVLKIGMVDISPILLVAVRFLIAVVFFLSFFAKRIFPISRGAVVKGCILSFFLFVGFVTQNIGLTITTASKSAFITSMMVIFVPFLQIAIEKRPPKVGNIMGIIIVVTGLWLLTSPSEAGFNMGDALTLVCAIVFAFYIVYLDMISREMTPMQLTFIQMAATGTMAVAAAVVFEDMFLRVTPASVGSILYLTGLATILTLYVQTRYQKDTTPTRAVIIFTLEPVFASFLAAVVLGEDLGTLGLVGAFLIIGGVLLSQLSDSIPGLRRSISASRETLIP